MTGARGTGAQREGGQGWAGKDRGSTGWTGLASDPRSPGHRQRGVPTTTVCFLIKDPERKVMPPTQGLPTPSQPQSHPVNSSAL